MSLEPDGGNFYRPHPLLIHSGRFWRCAHGITGLSGDLSEVGCFECAKDDPQAFAKWHSPAAQRREVSDG